MQCNVCMYESYMKFPQVLDGLVSILMMGSCRWTMGSASIGAYRSLRNSSMLGMDDDPWCLWRTFSMGKMRHWSSFQPISKRSNWVKLHEMLRKATFFCSSWKNVNRITPLGFGRNHQKFTRPNEIVGLEWHVAPFSVNSRFIFGKQGISWYFPSPRVTMFVWNGPLNFLIGTSEAFRKCREFISVELDLVWCQDQWEFQDPTMEGLYHISGHMVYPLNHSPES